MPWCEDCAKYWAPSAMRVDGSCPGCGRVLDVPRRSLSLRDVRRLAAGADADTEVAKAPWHFRLLMVMLGAYLVWRVIQLFVG